MLTTDMLQIGIDAAENYNGITGGCEKYDDRI